MEPETECVIDVESEQIDCTEPESIDRWYSASQVQRLLNLNKPTLQRAIAKLTSLYSLDIKVLRRGGARATQYSQVAVDAIELLNSQKFAELRKLVDKMSAVPLSPSTAIVFVDQHNQIASTAATAADTNLTQISALKTGLLSNYRELGRALGKQAAAEVQLGFTEEVAAGIKKLQES
ncbi:hypothetical protein QUA82_09820 [Microcoleus sp. F8-D3]